MNGINKVIIVGTLGNDPEVKFMPNGNAVANLSVATNEKWKDKNTQQVQERTEWHRIVIFGKLAEIAGQYLKKGSKAYFEGKLQTKKWQDDKGQDRYTTEIVANQMQMLDGPNQQPQLQPQQQYQQAPNNKQHNASHALQQHQPVKQEYTPSQPQKNSYAAAQQGNAPQNQQPHNGGDTFDQDIPF